MSNWQQHLPVLPVLLPLCAGAILLFPGETRRGLRAAIALGATLLQLVVAIVLLAGIAQYLYVQVALLDLSFAGLLKNSLMLFLGYLPRSGLGLLWQLLYWGAVALFWPISSFVLILTSLWLPCLLSLMAIYPALEKSFDIEKKIKAIREAQLHGDDDQ